MGSGGTGIQLGKADARTDELETTSVEKQEDLRTLDLLCSLVDFCEACGWATHLANKAIL